MQAIMIVGLARSGKDTAADFIAEKFGYAKYNFSDVLKEMLTAMKKEPTKENMIMLGSRLRKESGMDALAKRLDRKITKSGKIVLVGPRSKEEIDYFRAKHPELKIVLVSAGHEKRFKRRSNEDPQKKEGFFGRDKNDIESKGLEKAIQAAQFEIRNDSTKKELFRKIEELMERLSEK